MVSSWMEEHQGSLGLVRVVYQTAMKRSMISPSEDQLRLPLLNRT